MRKTSGLANSYSKNRILKNPYFVFSPIMSREIVDKAIEKSKP